MERAHPVESIGNSNTLAQEWACTNGRKWIMYSSDDEGSEEQIEVSTPRAEREHSRIATRLNGRYMLADRKEFECVAIDVALGGIALTAPESGNISETVIAYIDQIGRVQGDIVRYMEDGFALRLTLSPRAIEKLAARLSELQAGTAESHTDVHQRELRIEPDDNAARLSLPSGEETDCEVLDLSRSGAEIKIIHRPAIGAKIQLGRVPGTVVRHTEAGVAIRFKDMSDSVSLTDRLTDVAESEVAQAEFASD